MTTQQSFVGILGRGHHADGGEGVVLTKLMQGGLVPWLPKTNAYQSTGVAGSLVTARGSYYEFGDRGWPGGIQLITGNFAATNVGQQDASVFIPFSGRRVGLITYQLPNPSTTKQFDVFVDGRCVLAANDQSLGVKFDENSANVGPAFNSNTWVLADDLLSDGPHQLEVVARTPASGSVNVTILAVLVEERMGYKPLQPVDVMGVPSTLTTSYATMPFSSQGSGTTVGTGYARGVVGWRYINTDTVQHTILTQITYTGQGPFAYTPVVVPAASSGVPGTAYLPAGNGRPVGVDSNWQHKLNEVISSGSVTCFPEMAL